MNKELKSHYVEEVKYQTKILFGPTSLITRIVGIVGMILCVIISVIIGLGIRNGRNNVNKILDLIQ